MYWVKSVLEMTVPEAVESTKAAISLALPDG